MSEKPPTMREPQKERSARRHQRRRLKISLLPFFPAAFWPRGVATEGPLSFSAPPLQTNKQTNKETDTPVPS